MRVAAVVCVLAAGLALAAGCEQKQQREDVPQMDAAELEAPPAETAPLPVVEEQMPVPVGVGEPATAATGAQTYTIKPGDTLYTLARRYYGDGKLWTKIFEANKDKIRDVHDIPVGTVLVIPPK